MLSKTKKPNLLFIYTDEQRFDTLDVYGNNAICMPHLNRLAEKSFIFERAYVTQPVCTPSRSSLLTGLYPHTSGCVKNNIPLPPETLCFPEMLGDPDYESGHFGKWHLGDEIYPQHGFKYWRATEDAYSVYYSPDRSRGDRSSYHHFLVNNGFSPANRNAFSRAECARLPEEFGKPSYIAGESCRFIRENRRNPFCLFVNFLEPHMPFFGPRDGQYSPNEVVLPENFNDIPGPSHHLKTRLFREAYYRKGFGDFDLKTEEGWRRLIANYWGLCSLIDTHAGRILDTLDECGLEDDTIVVFTSDHGDMMGSHRLLAKCVMFEEAAKVPMMLRIPGNSGGKRIPEPVSQIDIVPTLLELMGKEAPSNLQGESLRASLKGESRSPAGNVFIEWNGDNSGILPDAVGGAALTEGLCERSGDIASGQRVEEAVSDPVRTVITRDGWKYNKSSIGEDELFNLKDDPLENNNLAGEKSLRALERELEKRISKWREKTDDAG